MERASGRAHRSTAVIVRGLGGSISVPGLEVDDHGVGDLGALLLARRGQPNTGLAVERVAELSSLVQRDV